MHNDSSALTNSGATTSRQLTDCSTIAGWGRRPAVDFDRNTAAAADNATTTVSSSRSLQFVGCHSIIVVV